MNIEQVTQGEHMLGHGGHMLGHGMFFGTFGNLLWLLLIGLLIWSLFRFLAKRPRPWGPPYGQGFPAPQPPHMHQHPGYQPPPPSAMEILRQRYARGEIDAVTFDQMRERLEASERPAQ